MSTALANHISRARTKAIRVQNEEINVCHTSATNNEDQQKVVDKDDIHCQTNRIHQTHPLMVEHQDIHVQRTRENYSQRIADNWEQ